MKGLGGVGGIDTNFILMLAFIVGIAYNTQVSQHHLL
jgi:hypothetical protein